MKDDDDREMSVYHDKHVNKTHPARDRGDSLLSTVGGRPASRGEDHPASSWAVVACPLIALAADTEFPFEGSPGRKDRYDMTMRGWKCNLRDPRAEDRKSTR